jgi:hypothetical protein
MEHDDREREWFEGSDKGSFATAARVAVENAEEVFRERGEEFPTDYDVQLRVSAAGVLSDYRVYVSPHT